MNRSALTTAVALLFSAVTASAAFAQAAKPAAPTTQAPAAPAKWVPPVKGTATIEVMRGQSRKVGDELVTPLKIKNTSTGAIHLLRINEYWYDKARNMVTAAEERYKKPLLPGEIVEINLKSPARPGAEISQLNFLHANGKIDAKTVKKF